MDVEDYRHLVAALFPCASVRVGAPLPWPSSTSC